MGEEPPFFEEAARQVEVKLGEQLGGSVKVSIHVAFDRPLIDDVLRIDNRMFREELRYSVWDLIKKGDKPGFFLIMVREGREPIAFFFGYEDDELPGGFYGDDMASIVEGKGIGGSLFTLVHIYCYENGYTHFSCHAEVMDDKGRRLNDWYKTAAEMEIVRTSPEEGDLLRVELTPGHVNWMYHRHILGEKDFKRIHD